MYQWYCTKWYNINCHYKEHKSKYDNYEGLMRPKIWESSSWDEKTIHAYQSVTRKWSGGLCKLCLVRINC